MMDIAYSAVVFKMFVESQFWVNAPLTRDTSYTGECCPECCPGECC